MKIVVTELNNGVYFPVVGLGSYGSEDKGASDAILEGLKHGYRAIDTAEFYGNYPAIQSALERYEKDKASHDGVCSATENAKAPKAAKVIDTAAWLKNFQVPHGDKCREDDHTIFVTTKVWVPLSAAKAKETLANCMKDLKRTQIDLLLLHWPGLSQRLGGSEAEEKDGEGNLKRRLEAWHQLEEEYAAGRVRAIGVSNFMVQHMTSLLEDIEKRQKAGDKKAVKPVVNQIEISPWLLPPTDLVFLCDAHNIRFTCYSPLGQADAAKNLQDPLVVSLAKKYNKSPANVVLRSLLERGFIVIPKSSNPNRAVSNYDVFDFTLTEEDLKEMEKLNIQKRMCPDPYVIA
eukprot:Blabericola_migrator_1__8445@NODE_4401_length_1179_cov_1069_437950_g2723_i0_p1_GENE_NODE_4401_length_1179_cov_1069_437950_g2723_i0NODE_4401_length_1179_cov_1069_437950_g2723_i0_p1_ORF_typecomplete_len346_score76_10Aldo_ket_red/PF00248_21/0_00055Aldo_ket_red/PF00248_21/1e45_NODE_4401_length_1179_cov_1069_437950_g2723_i0501087